VELLFYILGITITAAMFIKILMINSKHVCVCTMIMKYSSEQIKRNAKLESMYICNQCHTVNRKTDVTRFCRQCGGLIAEWKETEEEQLALDTKQENKIDERA